MASHFNFENMINEVTRLDTAVQKGPMMRWQRKSQDSATGLRLTISTDQRSNSSSLSPWKPKSAGLLKTPGKTPKTPLSASTFTPKTPGKTPLKGNRMPPKQFSKTPNKKMSKTPVQGQRAEDRFIPNRTSMDMERSHYTIMNQENLDADSEDAEYTKQLSDALSMGHNPKEEKILSFKQKVPISKNASNLRVLYSGSKCNAPKAQNTRFIPQQPERILDAPALLDDYYLNLIDWSSNDQLAVALGDAVFLWNAGTGTITQLCETGDPGEYISSVSWIKEGNVLALGTSTGDVALWDVTQQKSIRSMGGHAARVGSLAWNSYILSSGARSGAIHHHDVRVAEHMVGSLLHHTQEVCGLRWSPRGRYLASGGNDNVVNIWEPTLGRDVTPLHTLTDHQAAVKALAWCPWQPDLLASGGGTADRHIRFWSAASGAALNAVNTNSQVCSILWSKEHRELITGHGFSQNQLIVWKYPTMAKVTELKGHTSRILSLALSPDGAKVMSAAADETLRIWNCFAIDKVKKSAAASISGKENSSLNMLHRGIR